MSITLFKNITIELTDYEKKTVVPMLLDTLGNTREGKKFSSRMLVNWFTACRMNVSDVRIRKMVNYIRVLNLTKPYVLIGTSKGYFLTKDMRVIDAQIESMQGRVDSQLAVIDAFKAQKENLKHNN